MDGAWSLDGAQALPSIIVALALVVCPLIWAAARERRRLVVADGVTHVPAGAYLGRVDIREVVLPASLVSIGDFAFAHCTGIVSLHLPDALEDIGDSAFYGCAGIVDLHLHLPGALVSVGDGAFRGCTGLDTAALHPIKRFPHQFADGVLTIKHGTAAVPQQMCEGMTDIREVVLPASVIAIGDGAFHGCTGIVALHLPDALQKIGGRAFSGCTGLVALHLPDALESLGAHAFDGCAGIVDLQLPDALESLGYGAFHRCTGIVALHLPDALQKIGDYAFHGCTGLVALHLPDALQSVSKWAFMDCTSLVRVLAPDGLARGDAADLAVVFRDCPVVAAGLTPYSAVPPLRRTFWHPAMHWAWCAPGQRACVLAVLVAELRVDSQAEREADSAAVVTGLPPLPHDLWLLILEFVPRHRLGA